MTEFLGANNARSPVDQTNRSSHPIFLVGCPRSGTTLLQRILDAHSEIAIMPETHFVRRFWNRRGYFGALDDDANYDALVKAITVIPEFPDSGLSDTDFTAAAWMIDRSYPALFGLLLDSFKTQKRARIVGEKTPNHVLFIETLRQFFPGARFLNIVRDPRAVVNSWRQYPWSTGSLRKDAEFWRRHVVAGRRHQSAQDLHTMYYEQLIQAPEVCIPDICRFLGVAFEPDMLEFHQLKLETINIQREPWKSNVANRFDHEPLTRWLKDLSPAQVSQIEAIAWPEMKHHGYEPQTRTRQLFPLSVLLKTQILVGRVETFVSRKFTQSGSIGGIT